MQRRSLTWVLIVGLVLFALFVISLFSFMALISDDQPVAGLSGSGARIAMIPVEGVIDDQMAKNVNRYLKQYGDDARIRAIILRVDSPGGGVSASQEIYTELHLGVKRLND